MAKQRTLQLLRGTTAQNDAFTGAAGEVTVDTDTNELRVHDGSTAGGFAVAKKSSIPTVNNATLTIQKNGTTVNTFTANASSNVTANITVPTKISDLTNDSNFADKDLSNLSTTGKNLGNWSTNVSNCITAIPQDINLTLSSGTLTLKAGSKVYVPNGSGVFDVVTVAADKTITITGNQQALVYYSPSFNSLNARYASKSVSGSTRSLTTTYMAWYDTSNNVINDYHDNASTPRTTMSLPVALVTLGASGVESIDQVFNGFGYIGSTVFVLPGVKGLVPNYRNADGSLKSTAFTLSSVVTTTLSDTATRTVGVRANVIGSSTAYVYDEMNNQNLNNGSFWNVCAFAVVKTESGQITSFSPKTAFHAVDYSDWNEHRVVEFRETSSATEYKAYRKYADGSIDQWGFINNATWSSYQYTVTLPVAMRDALYASNATPYGNPSDDDYITNIQTQNTTTLTIRLRSGQKSCSWTVHGMAA